MPAPHHNHPGARRPGHDPDRQPAQQPGPPGQQPGRPATPSPARHPVPMIKERLLRVRLAYKRLTALSFPRRFPVVQFPNLPLTIAFLAGWAGKLLHGSAHPYVASMSYLAMTIWAYEELTHGVNWFRRLLGLAFMILLTLRVAHAIRP